MFFNKNFESKMNQQRNRNARRQQNFNTEDADNRTDLPRFNRNALIVQMLPLIILMFISIIPYLFQTVKFI